MAIRINRNTRIKGTESKAVIIAAENLARDISCVFRETKMEGAGIYLKRETHKPECFSLQVSEGSLEVRASDELGFIYGLYEISRSILGISDFWFWNDQPIISSDEILVPKVFCFHSQPYRIKYRGWFVNDEVLLHSWSVDRKKDMPWMMVFETLLRCGGNMVIPGTDRNSEYYRKMAAEMGLYITHHHAEPLGAEMFSRVYPKLVPSYAQYPEKFEALWIQSIKKQKDAKVIWNLGFRGQGDRPFWEDDPYCENDEARGHMMSQLIRIQYDLVRRFYPGAECCTYLYGETMELYCKGYLILPPDVIRIWSDNGYGKMVSRRQENHNPRIPALPERKKGKMNGIYYHVSFYDLQAANHVTMLSNSPEFVKRELQTVLECGGEDYWIVNCSNIKPHIYYLDFIEEMWKTGNIDIEKHRQLYAERYYGIVNGKHVAACIDAYFEHALAFGKWEDEHAGEQFPNYITRIFISQYMKNKNQRAQELLWATDAKHLREQLMWYKELCKKGKDSYGEYLSQCQKIMCDLSASGLILFQDTLLMQAQIQYFCYNGAFLICQAIENALYGDYMKAFYEAGKARREYRKADSSMRDREHGKWHLFYSNECLTDIKHTAWVIQGLMSCLRNLGDGPYYYKWQREFLYSEEDKRVILITNMENHLEDERLFEIMEEKWGD